MWGETSVDASGAEVRAARRPRQKKRSSDLLPHGASAIQLADAINDAMPVRPQDAREAIAWLPTIHGRAQPSSPLIAELSQDNGGVCLGPWGIETLELDPWQAVQFLCACAGKRVLRPGVILGSDVEFSVMAMRGAGELLARQQYVPDLIETNSGYEARWRHMPSGREREWLSRLAPAMPPVARALTLTAERPPAISAEAVLARFLDAVIDALVRESEPAAKSFESVHDQWLAALAGPHPEMRGEAARFAELRRQIREWQRPLSVAGTAPYRLCFRLEEPPNGGAWTVQYLLQAAADPSLLVSAAEVWKANGKRRFPGAGAREYLLSALGQAAGLCQRIKDSLKSPTPSGYEVDTAGAHEFLTQRAAALEESGFGVMLPAWWTRKGTKLRLTARAVVATPKMQAGTGISLETLVNFDWQAALGGEPLSRSELVALAKLKTPLVKVRGQWVEMNADEIRAALEFWKKKSAGAVTVRELVRMSLGAAAVPGGLPFDGVEAGGWVGELLDRLEGRRAFEELAAPSGFQGRLRPYQVRGYSWLDFLGRLGLGACLADDMGLGKTVQALAFIERQRSQGVELPFLLICPTSVVGNWQKEAQRFVPGLPVMVHHGTTRVRGDRFREEAARHALVLSSYALLHRDAAMLAEVTWGGVILDEAQNIRNPETKQARAARAAAGRLPHRAHGHAGREPRGRSVVACGVSQSRLARLADRVPAEHSIPWIRQLSYILGLPESSRYLIL